MTQFVLWVSPGPFPAMPGCARVESNGAGLVPTYLTWANFFGIDRGGGVWASSLLRLMANDSRELGGARGCRWAGL
jgi:hypothetical protein